MISLPALPTAAEALVHTQAAAQIQALTPKAAEPEPVLARGARTLVGACANTIPNAKIRAGGSPA